MARDFLRLTQVRTGFIKPANESNIAIAQVENHRHCAMSRGGNYGLSQPVMLVKIDFFKRQVLGRE